VTSHFLLHHLHRIGSGSFGTVYRVRGKLDGIGYAIKKSRRRPHSQHERTSMMSEVHALAALSASTATQYEDDISSDKTNSIVRYYSAWIEESDQTLCIQMELCESSAADALHFTHQTAYQLLRDILNALDLLHSNDFVHLDIKPANILVKKNRFKLADFGLALHTTNGKFNGNVEEGDSRYLSFSLSLSLSPCSLSLFSHSSLSFASPLSLSGMLCRLLCVVLCRYMAKELLNWGQISDLTKCDLFSLGISGTSLSPLTSLHSLYSFQFLNFILANLLNRMVIIGMLFVMELLISLSLSTQPQPQPHPQSSNRSRSNRSISSLSSLSSCLLIPKIVLVLSIVLSISLN
jgi:serine/threonine protein kinase